MGVLWYFRRHFYQWSNNKSEATLQSNLDTTISSCQEKSIEDLTFPNHNELANTANLLTPSTIPLSDSMNLQIISSCTDSSLLSSYDLWTTSKNTSLHNLRKKQLEIEQKKIEAISRMEEFLNNSNKIQEKKII